MGVKQILEERGDFYSHLWEIRKIKEEMSKNQFVKYDSGKLEYSLIPPESLESIIKVLQHGAKKYDKDNWKRCKDHMRYYDACMRHLEAWRRGETIDNDSGHTHLSHALCSILFLEWLEENKCQNR